MVFVAQRSSEFGFAFLSLMWLEGLTHRLVDSATKMFVEKQMPGREGSHQFIPTGQVVGNGWAANEPSRFP